MPGGEVGRGSYHIANFASVAQLVAQVISNH